MPILLLLPLLALAHAQTISTNTPVPPLQWINLTSVLQGNAPPPLKDAAIGYDETRSVPPTIVLAAPTHFLQVVTLSFSVENQKVALHRVRHICALSVPSFADTQYLIFCQA
jgi:hypothetical protein